MKTLLLSCAIAIAFLCGCGKSFPHIRSDYVASRMQNIPQDAAPILFWKANGDFQTYWGKQHISVEAAAYFPGDAAEGNGLWRVTAENSEGKPVPYIGHLRRYSNPDGSESPRLVPTLDLDQMPDGLYVVIDSNITRHDGKIMSIKPIAEIREIRHHTFKPFCAPLPLIPTHPSELTPMPPPPPPAPEGTALPE